MTELTVMLRHALVCNTKHQWMGVYPWRTNIFKLCLSFVSVCISLALMLICSAYIFTVKQSLLQGQNDWGCRPSNASGPHRAGGPSGWHTQ